MDDYLFKHHVNECLVVHERTAYLEIFNYSVSGDGGVAAATQGSCAQHAELKLTFR